MGLLHRRINAASSTFAVVDHMMRYMLNLNTVVTYCDKLLDYLLPQGRAHRGTYQRVISFLIRFVLVLLTAIPAVFSDFYVEFTTLCGASVGVMMRTDATIILCTGLFGAAFTIIRSFKYLKHLTES
ncbi:hypothetical protein L1987_11434 [Smallanthus sonchifolius]|uniref:Uncharacterized protein n=1 Tax=Smallanthus sonchifolius TaxID=185202 RepID=A0ACB9JD78_9ASTR|nr:hypothetical protein L1987_11434 [Smallanthus sonchifolius]